MQGCATLPVLWAAAYSATNSLNIEPTSHITGPTRKTQTAKGDLACCHATKNGIGPRRLLAQASLRPPPYSQMAVRKRCWVRPETMVVPWMGQRRRQGRPGESLHVKGIGSGADGFGEGWFGCLFHLARPVWPGPFGPAHLARPIWPGPSGPRAHLGPGPIWA